jgi:hypothetical protein
MRARTRTPHISARVTPGRPRRAACMGRADAAGRWVRRVLACCACGGRRWLVALIEQPAVIAGILRHPGFPMELPGDAPHALHRFPAFVSVG